MEQPTIVSAVSNWPVSQIGAFLDYLTIECGLSVNTIVAYRRDLRRFSGYCSEKSLAEPEAVTPLIVQGYGRYLSSERLATASIARHIVSLRMFLRWHVLFGLLAKDICAVLETPKTWQRLPKVISSGQTIELISSVDIQNPLATRDRALLELLYATGMRASEIADLNLEDVNFQIGYLRCFGKGQKERIIPLHETAIVTLKTYLEQLRDKLVGQKQVTNIFVSRTGRRLSRIEVWRVVRRAAVRAGMTGRISPHTLRHCFGSHLLAGGADLRCVQELLGHADVTTTQIYTHVDPQRLRNVHKKYHPRP